MRRHLPIALLLLLLLLPASSAGATKGKSRDLWATVNVCDPPEARNVIGIRASMPGNGTRQRMYMHFSAEWYDEAKKQWVPTGSSSPWVHVGSARYVSTQAGYSFQFADPPAQVKFLMRGVVRFQWRARKSKRVLRKRTLVTKAGYRDVQGGIPLGRSDSICVIQA